MDVPYMEHSKAFGSVSPAVLAAVLMSCGLDEQTVRWIEN